MLALSGTDTYYVFVSVCIIDVNAHACVHRLLPDLHRVSYDGDHMATECCPAFAGA